MSNSYRLDQIYSLLLRNGKASVDELAQCFNVTSTTIRRDLLLLEDRGLIYRTRGYAYIVDSNALSTSGILEEEKKRIAEAAMNYVQLPMSIAMDSGSTVYAVCDELINRFSTNQNHMLDIVTHSLSIALRASKYFQVSMPGGAVMQDTLVGVDVSDFYQKINVDLTFLSSTGVNNCNGLTVSYPLQLSVKEKTAACAKKRIAVLDSSKFIKRGIYTFCNFKDIDIMITVETDDNKEQLDYIYKQGVDIVTV
mgnify:CR=1 FL=1